VTITVVGCGTLGTAIIQGNLSSISIIFDSKTSAPLPHSDFDKSSAPERCTSILARKPSQFICCVRIDESVRRISHALAPSITAGSIAVLQNENIEGVQQADVITLGCKSYMVSQILNEPGMSDALDGKLLVSILAAVSASQIERSLSSKHQRVRTRVDRAMPTLAPSCANQ
jgi:pyrroline-5-carboxylate reductase